MIGPHTVRNEVHRELFAQHDAARERFTDNYLAYRYRRRFTLVEKVAHNAAFFLGKSTHPITLRYVASGKLETNYLHEQREQQIQAQQQRFDSNSHLAEKYLNSYSVSQQVSASARSLKDVLDEDVCRYLAAERVIHTNNLNQEKSRFENNPQLAKRYLCYLRAHKLKGFSELAIHQRGKFRYRMDAIDEIRSQNMGRLPS